MTYRLPLLLFCILRLGRIGAEEPGPPVPASAGQAAVAPEKTTKPAPPNIFVEARCVSLPQNLAGPLIRKFRAAKAGQRAQALTELDELIAGGGAKLHGWPVLTTHAGERAVFEDLDEFRYATEFGSETLNVYIHDGDGNLSKQPREVPGTDSQPMATSFGTRNLGLTMEVDPEVSDDGKSIDLNLVLQHVRLKAVERTVIERETLPEKRTTRVTQEQPRFSDMKTTTRFTLESGDVKVVGIFRSPEGENQLELFIVRAAIGDQ